MEPTLSPYQIDVIIDDPMWDQALPEAALTAEQAAIAALEAAGLLQYSNAIEVAILLTDDAKVQSLNAQFRDQDKPTNVLSFPAMDLHPNHLEVLREDAALMDGMPLILGDIAVARQTLFREAAKQNIPPGHHLQHLVVHGALHLLGYDHMDDKDAEFMEALEVTILKQLGVANPYAEIPHRHIDNE